MPKLAPSFNEAKNRQVRAIISSGMELQGIDEVTLAKRIGRAKRTLQDKRKRPEIFTLQELRALAMALKLDETQKAQLIG